MLNPNMGQSIYVRHRPTVGNAQLSQDGHPILLPKCVELKETWNNM